MVQRWPVHPQPLPGEALSSWVARLGQLYDWIPRRLFCEGLGLEPVSDFILDAEAPSAVVKALAERTGFPQKTIRSMTLQSWVPSLVDRLTADFEGGAFNDYVHQYSVLLSPARSVGAKIIDWTAWTSPEIARDPLICRDCLDNEAPAYHRLHWRTCLIATCPIHKTFLLTTSEEKNLRMVGGKRVTPESVPMNMLRLDALTQQAIQNAYVVFNGRKIKSGVWVRLLHTILDELSTVMVSASTECDILRSVWEKAGIATRVRAVDWRPFEHLPAEDRRKYLVGAASAIELLELDKLKTAGDDAKLLRRKGAQSGLGRERATARAHKLKPSDIHRLSRERTKAKAVFSWARRDPKGARYVREVLLTSEKGLDKAKEAFLDFALSELGIDPGTVVTDGMHVGIDKEALSHWEGRRIYHRR